MRLENNGTQNASQLLCSAKGVATKAQADLEKTFSFLQVISFHALRHPKAF